jgi:hypothetical protein
MQVPAFGLIVARHGPNVGPIQICGRRGTLDGVAGSRVVSGRQKMSVVRSTMYISLAGASV